MRYGDLFVENCVFFIHLCHSALPLLSSLWNFTVKLSIRKLESWGYSVVKVA